MTLCVTVTISAEYLFNPCNSDVGDILWPAVNIYIFRGHLRFWCESYTFLMQKPCQIHVHAFTCVSLLVPVLLFEFHVLGLCGSDNLCVCVTFVSWWFCCIKEAQDCTSYGHFCTIMFINKVTFSQNLCMFFVRIGLSFLPRAFDWMFKMTFKS